MTGDVRARVEAAILRALAGGPLTGGQLAERLRAVPGLLDGADWWPRLLTGLRAAGRLTRVNTHNRTLWSVTPPAVRGRHAAAS